MAYDPAAGGEVLFGGGGTTYVVFGDTWCLCAGRWAPLNEPGPVPSARADALMVTYPPAGGVLLYGGLSAANGFLSDTWILNGSGWHNVTPAASPPPLFAPAMAFDASSATVVLFGGADSGGVAYSDTWLYSAGSWTQARSSTAPPAREQAAFAPEAGGHSLVLYGGYALGQYFTDTWQWSDGSWSEIPTPTNPGPVRFGLFAPDPAAGYDLLFGGAGPSGTGRNATWAFQYGAWDELSGHLAGAPGARWATAMAFDPGVGGDLLFGGCTTVGCTAYLSDTWEYRAASLAATITVSAAGESGLRVDASANASGGFGGPFNFSWSTGAAGAAATGNPASLTFSKSGSYELNLTVRDSAGLGSTFNQTIAVPIGQSGQGGSPATVAWFGLAWYVWLLGAAGVALASAWLVRRRRSDLPPPAAGPGLLPPPRYGAMEVGAPLVPEMRGPRETDEPPGDAAAVDSPTGLEPGAPPSPVPRDDSPLASQILLHLYRQPRLGPDDVAGVGHTQEGMSQGFGRPQSSFARALARLREQGLVIEGLHHVAGKPRRRKAYRLTAKGEAAARQMHLAATSPRPPRD